MRERVAAPVVESASAATSSALPEPPAVSAEPTTVPSAQPVSTGPTRETLCEKALFDLERAAALPIDKCIGPRPIVHQPITIAVRVDDDGSIADTVWDQSTTTAYGGRAASCILASVKALPFAEPACANERLLLRRAVKPSPALRPRL